MLKIKLSKVGKTNKKVYRIIISEKGRDPFGHHLEILGSYNPYSKELKVKGERIKYWLSKGAKCTASLNNLLVGEKIISGEKVKASKKGEPKKTEKKEEIKDEKKEEVKDEKKEEVKEEVDKKA
jgi:small subunit ribosomal protein S16